MKVLGICCSPRKKGNTEILLQEALTAAREAGAEVELVTVAGKDLKPCDACETCRKTGKCHIKDDMQDIYTKLLGADGIIFGTPVYYWSVTAQAKIVIDRTMAFGPGRLRGKVAGVVVTASRAGTTSTFTVFNNWFNNARMIMAGGAIGFSPVTSPHGVVEGFPKEGVRNDRFAMDEAKALGRAVVKRIQVR